MFCFGKEFSYNIVPFSGCCESDHPLEDSLQPREQRGPDDAVRPVGAGHPHHGHGQDPGQAEHGEPRTGDEVRLRHQDRASLSQTQTGQESQDQDCRFCRVSSNCALFNVGVSV